MKPVRAMPTQWHCSTRRGIALLLAAAGLLFTSTVAAKPLGPARRQVRETATCRIVTKVQQLVLPADRANRIEGPGGWQTGKRVQVQEGARSLVRRVCTDAEPANGQFVRTIRTTTVTAKGAEGPWVRPADDYQPRWSKRDAEHLYTSKQLGTIYQESSVAVRLFAPQASKAYLVLDETGERIRLKPDRSGVWQTTLKRTPAELAGKKYHFEADDSRNPGALQSFSNPYCHLTAGDYGPSRFSALAPAPRTRSGSGPVVKQLQARGITEFHVKDMTAHQSSPVASSAERGTYLGLQAPGVLAHYDELNVGGMEALPVSQFDKASGDLRKGPDGKRHPTINHWGYMTTHYPAVHEGWAARKGAAHHELRQAIETMKQHGKAVILDIAFNHTAKGTALHFNVLGRDYYYRLGGRADGAGCGNELSTERPMVRKLIVQTLRDFVVKFGVEGFRLDLGSLIDKETMRAIDRALPKHVFLTAEPWSAEWTRSRWGKGDLQDTRLAVWNDDFRNVAWTFLDGKGNGDARNKLMNAVSGSVRAYGNGFAARPSQSVNYVESHDELTLADRVNGNKQRAFLGQVLLFTSQGIPMMGHGQEFMRRKQYQGKAISNTHNLDNEASWVDWRLKQQNRDFFDATKGLMALRAASPHFQYTRALTDRDISWLTPDNANALGYLVRPPAGTPGRKGMPDYLVLMNFDQQKEVTFNLPRAGDWNVVVDGATLQVNTKGLRTAAGTYRLPAGTAVILGQARPAGGPAEREER